MQDAIKVVQNTPAKNHKHKKSVDTSMSNSVEGNLMPKPHKKNPRSMAQAQATTESASNADLPHPPKRVVKSVLNNEGDNTEEDLPPKKGAKKNKGKGKATQEPPINEDKATTGANQLCDGNTPKFRM